MGYVYVASSGASFQADASAGTVAITLGVAVEVGDVIVGMSGWGDGGTDNISTVDDNLGNSYSVNSDKIIEDFDGEAGQTWRSKVTVAGTPVITVTFSAAVQFRRIIAGAWRGGAAVPFDTSLGHEQGPNGPGNPGTGADAVTSTNITTAENNELLVGFHQNTSEGTPGAGTVAAGTNYTMRHNPDAILAMEDRVLASAGAVAATFTISVDHSTICHIVALKEDTTPPGEEEPFYRQNRSNVPPNVRMT